MSRGCYAENGPVEFKLNIATHWSRASVMTVGVPVYQGHSSIACIFLCTRLHWYCQSLTEWKHTCVRSRTTLSEVLEISLLTEQLCEQADKRLFFKICYNNTNPLHYLLPPKVVKTHKTRFHGHPFQLPCKRTRLDECNLLCRILYINVYKL